MPVSEATPTTMPALAQAAATWTVLDADHTGLRDVKERIIEHLAVRKLRSERGLTDGDERNTGTILLLVGPPGVGKTYAMLSRANRLKAAGIALGSVATHLVHEAPCSVLVTPAAEELDLTSEQILLEVDQDRGMCCHLGGDFVWDAAGNLYLSTGDDTDPFESAGYTPIDERPNRNPAYDAQRSSANTNDLRGKILRITPDPEDPTSAVVVRVGAKRAISTRWCTGTGEPPLHASGAPISD